MSSTKFVFSGRSEKQDGRPGLWLAETFSASPLKPLNRIPRNLTGSKISTSSTNYQVCVFLPIGKTRWPPRLLIGWDIFDFSSENTEQNSTKLERKQDHNVLYQVCVFLADRKRPGEFKVMIIVKNSNNSLVESPCIVMKRAAQLLVKWFRCKEN